LAQKLFFIQIEVRDFYKTKFCFGGVEERPLYQVGFDKRFVMLEMRNE